MDLPKIKGKEMQSVTLKLSAFDVMYVILSGKRGEETAESEGFIARNRELLSLLGTSVAVLVSCVLLILWRRSVGQKAASKEESLRLARLKQESKTKADDGKKKVTVLFGTQTGTTEGLTKVRDYKLNNIRSSSFFSDLFTILHVPKLCEFRSERKECQ